MSNVVTEIFEVLDGPTAIHRGTGIPVQTVHSWLAKGDPEIPPWRRAQVLTHARNCRKLDDLSAEAQAYLKSDERPRRTTVAA